MTTLAYILGFIIIGFIFAVLFGRAARLGAEQEVAPPVPRVVADKLADRLDALITERKAAELAWMIELQERIAENRIKLDAMRMYPVTHELIGSRTEIRVQIDGDERALELLRKRGERDSAASHYEGRM